jgi:hypothetical protein
MDDFTYIRDVDGEYDLLHITVHLLSAVYSGIFRGGQQIQLRREDRENGDLGALAP